MDGINPTLAFAALFFGLSGHPRDVAERPVEPEHTNTWQSPGPSDQEIGHLFDCPGMAVAADDQNAPQDFDPLQDHRIALTSSVLRLDPPAAESPSPPGELSTEIFQDQDGCGELTPEP